MIDEEMSDEEMSDKVPDGVPDKNLPYYVLKSGREYYIEDIITRSKKDPTISGRASGTFVGNDYSQPQHGELEPTFLIFSDLKQVNEKLHGLDSYIISFEDLEKLKKSRVLKESGDLDPLKTYYKFLSSFLIVLEKRFTHDFMERVNEGKICAILAGKHWEEKNDKKISALPGIIMKEQGLSSEVYNTHNAKYKEKNPPRAFLLEIELQKIKQECLKLARKKEEEEKASGKGGKSRKNKRVRKSRRSVSIKNRRKSRRSVSIKNRRKSRRK